MSDIQRLTEVAGSGRGLEARVMLTTDVVGYRADIASIAYQIYVDGVETVASTALVVADVMLTTLTAWGRDSTGKTFHWDAPGSLWPTEGNTYVIVVTLTPQAGDGEAFKLRWSVTTIAASAE